jgi:hypothetical protein
MPSRFVVRSRVQKEKREKDNWLSRNEKVHQSCHSQTFFRNVDIETFLPFISTIHGCSSIRHGVALRVCSFSRLRIEVSLAKAHKRCGRTYQHSMKYLKLSLHLMLFSGSSLNTGMGCRTMYVSKSIRPALGCISVPSAGNGNLC